MLAILKIRLIKTDTDVAPVRIGNANRGGSLFGHIHMPTASERALMSEPRYLGDELAMGTGRQGGRSAGDFLERVVQTDTIYVGNAVARFDGYFNPTVESF